MGQESVRARHTAGLSGRDLKYIGMPVGGLCAGQLYLGGDGKLWHWDIFNSHIVTGYDGALRQADDHRSRPSSRSSN